VAAYRHADTRANMVPAFVRGAGRGAFRDPDREWSPLHVTREAAVPSVLH
jgi:hypothetical protein